MSGVKFKKNRPKTEVHVPHNPVPELPITVSPHDVKEGEGWKAQLDGTKLWDTGRTIDEAVGALMRTLSSHEEYGIKVHIVGLAGLDV